MVGPKNSNKSNAVNRKVESKTFSELRSFNCKEMENFSISNMSNYLVLVEFLSSFWKLTSLLSSLRNKDPGSKNVSAVSWIFS